MVKMDRKILSYGITAIGSVVVGAAAFWGFLKLNNYDIVKAADKEFVANNAIKTEAPASVDAVTGANNPSNISETDYKFKFDSLTNVVEKLNVENTALEKYSKEQAAYGVAQASRKKKCHSAYNNLLSKYNKLVGVHNVVVNENKKYLHMLDDLGAFPKDVQSPATAKTVTTKDGYELKNQLSLDWDDAVAPVYDTIPKPIKK